MSTFNYPGIRNTSPNLLTKFGKAVILTRSDNGGSYDPATGGISGGSTLSLDGVAVLLSFDKNEIDGEHVRAEDLKMLYLGDILAVGDVYDNYRVHAINELDPDQSGTLLTTVQLRQ